MSLIEEKDTICVLAKSILTSISDVTKLVPSVEYEQENFMEIGCYLQRTSPAVMELQTTSNVPPNAIEILNSLYKNVEMAKELVMKCKSRDISITGSGRIIGELEGVIRNIGESLSLIPSSAFQGQEFAECAVRSLSREMQNANIQTGKLEKYECEDSNTCFEAIQRQEEKEMTESDLYSIQAEYSMDYSLTVADVENKEMPRLMDFLRGMSYGKQVSYGSTSQALKTVPQVAEYMEPLYETFFCPSTKMIMDDPVTIGSGITYERKAIIEWFNKCEEGSQEIHCPTTGQKLESRSINTNLALKITIEEWKERNEATLIKATRAALSLASSESMIREALKDLQHLGRKKKYNKVLMRNVGIIPLLVQVLEHEVRKVRCETLVTLELLAEEDEESKEVIAQTKAISTTIKMLSSDYPPERHLSLLFLLELSRSDQLCEEIGSVAGGILLLITLMYNKSVDAFAAEKADEILRNLEKCSNNIKIMAENGLLDPLLNHLVEGVEDIQMEMVSYLGDTVLGRDTKTYVAERASSTLIKMVHSGNTYARKAAFKALVHISSNHPNNNILVEAGIVPIMADEMFTRKIYNEPMDSKEESAAILANILESGTDPQTLRVNSHGHTMASDYVIYNMIHMLKNSAPDETSIHLINILLCLTKCTRALASVVSVTKETDASYKLIELIDSEHEDLAVASTKLLINLSPNMGHTIADRLCKTSGQPECLVRNLDTNSIKEKHAVWATLLSKLPHQNLTLNMALLQNDKVPMIIRRIHDVARGETRASRFNAAYLEGLVGMLVRFTTTLYDPQILTLAKANNLASLFTELLMRTGSDEVQRLAAIGLENLSSESIHLSRPPTIKRPKYNKILPKCFIPVRTKEMRIKLCPVHRGQCSSQTTFCLLDSRALDRLLACLDHENPEVVEAALSAICTLLDDKVDVDKSVSVLSEVNTMQHVLNVLREHRQEGVWQKSFWVIEKFIAKGDKSISDISSDRLLPATLVSAFHHGEGSTKQMAEKILRYLNKMPNFSSNVAVRN